MDENPLDFSENSIRQPAPNRKANLIVWLNLGGLVAIVLWLVFLCGIGLDLRPAG